MKEVSPVSSVVVKGLYDRFDLEHQFFEGINIIYGNNGTGKSTLLHILANVLNEDYSRFVFLDFKEIRVLTKSGRKILLTQTVEGDDRIITVKKGREKAKEYRLSKVLEEQNEKINMPQEISYRYRNIDRVETGETLKAAYFPAFRAVLEAWALPEKEINRSYRMPPNAFLRRINNRMEQVTGFARQLFGQFVPMISYPSLLEVQAELAEKVNEALFTVAKADNEIVSNAFVQILKSLTENDDDLFEKECSAVVDDIKKYSHQLEESATFKTLSTIIQSGTFSDNITSRHILDVYLKSLKNRANTKERAFQEIEKYLNSVNQFLDNKKIAYAKTRRFNPMPIYLEYSDNSKTDFLPLSSGERQIVTMIFSATRMNQQRIILVDEPEISLHPDWQRRLLPSMLEQLENRQVIVCTHSPIISADYEEFMKELVLIPMAKTRSQKKKNVSLPLQKEG